MPNSSSDRGVACYEALRASPVALLGADLKVVWPCFAL
jgi:hypothetical protein